MRTNIHSYSKPKKAATAWEESKLDKNKQSSVVDTVA